MSEKKPLKPLNTASILVLLLLFGLMFSLARWMFTIQPCYYRGDRGFEYNRINEVPEQLEVSFDTFGQLSFYAFDENGMRFCQFSGAESKAAISPDGLSIAFEYAIYPRQILVSDIAGNNIRVVSFDLEFPYPARSPIWSPDSQLIAFRYGDIGTGAYIASADGSYLKGVELEEGVFSWGNWADWSPDSQWLALVVHSGPGDRGDLGLYLLNKDGEEFHQIIETELDNQFDAPHWSDSGESIRYLSGGIYDNESHRYEYHEECTIVLETSVIECTPLD